MGWSFAISTSVKKSDVIARVRSGNFFSEGYTHITDRVVGNRLWGVLEQPNGLKTIFLVMMAGGGRREGWGYKSVTESMGPCELDCPLSLLKMVDAPPNDWAKEWRAKVEAFHANADKRKEAIGPGAIVGDARRSFTLLEKMSGRRGWIVQEAETGTRYRMNFRQLALCKVLSGIPKPAPAPERTIAPRPTPMQQSLALDCAIQLEGVCP